MVQNRGITCDMKFESNKKVCYNKKDVVGKTTGQTCLGGECDGRKV